MTAPRPDRLPAAPRSLDPDLADQGTQVAYLAALHHFARVGGVSAPEEAAMARLARGLGCRPEAVALARQLRLDREALTALLAKIDGTYLFRDVLRIAIADGILDEDEEQVVARLAPATGVTLEQARRIRSWVAREHELLEAWDYVRRAKS